MVPSYGASTAHAVLNAFSRSLSPISTSKSGSSIIANMSSNSYKALAKSKDKRISSPISSLRSSGASSQGPTLHDSEDADTVFVSSPNYTENNANKNTADQLFTETEIQDIFRPRSNCLRNGKTDHGSTTVANGTTSPKRNSRTSRESTGSSCSEGHAELSKSNSSSNALSPLPKLLESLSPAERASMTRPQIVAQEILVTERTYVRDLQEVIEGYLIHLLHHGMTDVDIETIFGNLEDIYDFNKNILEELENIEEQRDPVLISQCFLKKAEGFNSLYVQYCTNYPESAAFLTEILKDKEISDFFLERQKALGHTLPLDSYLMKPVQRIMKYHLLFKDMAKHVDVTTPGFDVVQTTAAAMADVAEYINEMKRLHENALRVEEILGSIEDLNGLDVFATGRLVLENLFRIQGSRGDKQLYLFEKLLLICKKLDEGNYQFRDGISCSNMMLVESIAKEPLCFQLIRFDNQKVTYTIQAKTLEIKREWTKQLKRLIIENHSAMIPLTAREAILGPDKNIRESKYNTIPLQALDEKIHWRRQKQNSYAGKENHQKDRGSILIGAKRESMVKDEASNSPKKSSLNTKAKDFLDKKDNKEKAKPWKLKRHKPRKTTSSTSFETEVPPRQVMSPNSDVAPPSTIVKSRSLESLRDALSGSQEDLVAVTEETTPTENEKSHEANEQIRRLSLLHDLIVSDTSDQAESCLDQPTEDKKPSENVHETPRNIKALRRMHVSKSVYLDLPDDPLRPGDLKRSRPLSLPPGAHDDAKSIDFDSINEVKQKVFEEVDEKQPRTCNDLRKYGLTRTRSFSRKSRGSNTSLAGSSSSVNAMIVDSDEQKKSTNDPDDFDQLEKRLSIISDDDKASTSIKDTLRQVSQAFSSYGSERTLNSVSSKSDSNPNLNIDLGAFLLQDIVMKPNAAARSKRRSLGSIISDTINPIKNLDESKKRAYSTTVINEVSLDNSDEEVQVTDRAEHHEVREIVPNQNDDEDSKKSVKDRICEYVSKSQTSDGDSESVVRLGENSSVSQTSSDSQVSYTELQKINKVAPCDANEASSPSASIMNRPADTSPVRISDTDNETKTPIDIPKSIEQTSNNVDTAMNTNQDSAATADLLAPKRPAAPSSLNYVGSYAASVRRYRKKNVEIKESKSVYERIREYTALVSEEKSMQRGKSVDEMLETLDSANMPVSNTYIEQRRKFANMASVSVCDEKIDSVLGNPEVWFDTDSDKKVNDKRTDIKPTTKSQKDNKAKPLIDKSESKNMKSAFTLSRIRFKDLEDEKLKENKSNEAAKDKIDVKNVMKNAKQGFECNTLPRSKVDGKKDKVNGVNKVNKNNATSQTGSSAKDWKNRKSHTVERVTFKTDKVDNNDNDTIAKSSVNNFSQEESEHPSTLVVKDIVKEYQKSIIIPGQNEVEEMRDSNMRRSKKKKDKEIAKSNLQRKLSLRNLDAEEKEEKAGKLSRSVSCESVQRGTVKQLISLFSIRK